MNPNPLIRVIEQRSYENEDVRTIEEVCSPKFLASTKL